MKSISARCLFLMAGIMMTASTTRAGFLTYELTYSGAAFGNHAIANATITLDLAKLNNPGFTEQDVSPFVTAFSITVSGAKAGNGTFGIDDYLGGPSNVGGFFLDTNGGTLDFTRELFGQPTAGLPYGSDPDSGNSGDFNIDPNNVAPAAPIATFFFQILTNGGYGDAESLYLTSFRPIAVPEPSSLSLMASVAPVAGAFLIRRWGHRSRARAAGDLGDCSDPLAAIG